MTALEIGNRFASARWSYSGYGELGIAIGRMLKRLVLEFQNLARFGGVRDLENESGVRCGDEKVLIALARKLVELACVDVVRFAQDLLRVLHVEPRPCRFQHAAILPHELS